MSPSTDLSSKRGLRALRNDRFRLLVATMLMLIGLAGTVMFLVRLGATPEPRAHDFVAYYRASERLLESASPYSSAQLDGPVDAFCEHCYLYPPLLAQVISPLTALPLQAAQVLWFAMQGVAMVVALWLATGIGGARRTLERSVWCVVASVFFVPVFTSLWFGNISTLLALFATLVAMGGVAAGVGGALGALAKVVGLALVPATLVMERRSRWSLVLVLGAVGAISFMAAPSASVEYFTVLRNLLAGSVGFPDNFAPAALVTRSGLSDTLVTLVRAATIVGAIACVVASTWMARSRDGWRLAALLGVVAMLLLPGTLWYHYLAILLPFAAMAWPAASGRMRLALLASASMIASGVGALPVALFGAGALVVVEVHALWPHSVSGASLLSPRLSR